MPRVIVRKPEWIRSTVQHTDRARKVRRALREYNLHTVCEESNCPNRGECYDRGTCTLLIMGPVCTRNCRFCSVEHGRPGALDPEEPANVAETVRRLGVRYVVVTSVDRDDLRDGGAQHYADTIRAIRARTPHVQVEVLTPDFRMNETAIDTVLAARPAVFAHNVETVRRLTASVRDRRASFDTSLAVLEYAHRSASEIPVKSGLMVGLGETDREVIDTLAQIRAAGATSVTIGQYLPPTRRNLPVQRFVEPARFREYEDAARALGFAHVASGPMVRSSYRAEEITSQVRLA